MALLPDLQALRTAADAVDRTAAGVDGDAAAVDRLVEAVPWRGPLRERVVGEAKLAVGAGRAQAAAERELARALRRLALEVEHEAQLLAALAAQARRHLEELLQRAHAVAAATAATVADAVTSAVPRLVLDVVTGDPAAAVREARRLADRAADTVRAVTDRLQALPDPADPRWRQLGPELLRWRPL